MKFRLFLNPAVAIEAMAGFVVITSLLALVILITPGTGDRWVIDGLNSVISSLLCLLIAHRLSLGVKNKRALCAWIAAFVVTAILSLTQWCDDYVERVEEALHIEDIDDICLWFVTPVGFLVAGRFERVGRFPLVILIGGFCAQSLSTVLDLLDGWLTNSVGYDSDIMEMMVNFSEFVFLQLYLIGLTLFMASIYIFKEPSHTGLRDPRAIGARARRLFDELDLFATPRFPRQPLAHLPAARYLIEVARTGQWFGALSESVRRRFGKPINLQLQEIILLMLRDGLDAQAYYMMELFRDDRLDQAGRYLTRYETKNGLFKALNKALLDENWLRTKLGNKRKFAELCEKAGIPTISTFITFERGAANWRIDDRTLLDRDLFAKLGKGKGARGTTWFQRIAVGRYRIPDGKELSLDEVLESLQAKSLEAPIVLQARQTNHPAIADLATDSLLVVRVITCLDRKSEPEVTHGMLRILGKLEPTWAMTSEYGAPVDLGTGRLGALTGDKIGDALDWHGTHPVTGARVEERILPLWPEIRELAVRAHRACRGRLVVGWDIALTAQGPLVVEGNGLPDVAFLQRVHRSAIGTSPLGLLLSFHLDRLEASRRKTQ
ncbi:MAG TPA: sugar-transfer associated ATP-grasp domain-containing protein [Dongiaceae bacterium]